MIERGTEWRVLDKGFIRLVDWLGSDESICNAARISYGKGTRSVSDDTNLIRYLMRHRHTSPTEMCELIIHVKAPIYVFRQWHRHRMASLNEYSGRYSEMIDECERTDQWRLQSDSNKQGSKSGKIEWPEHMWSNGETPEQYLSRREGQIQEENRYIYNQRLKLGVAKEQARKDLPVSNYSEMVWKCDLHNLLHFLSLRMDEHAQKEIRSYAEIIGNKIVAQLWPITWCAFNDYKLQSITFSKLEIENLRKIIYNIQDGNLFLNEISINNKRELQEFIGKLKQIGIKNNGSLIE